MAKVDGAYILAKSLKSAGVEKVFTLVGGHIYRVYQELEKVGIETIDLRSESAAGYAALTYAMLSDKPSVLIATAGPGVTHCVTPIIDASLSQPPLIMIGGATPAHQLQTGAMQEYDTLHTIGMHCRWSARCTDTYRVAEYFAIAHRNAFGAKMGPVYLELPVDVLELNKIDEEDVYYPKNYMAECFDNLGDPDMVEKAADMLIAAQRPVIVYGDGAQYLTAHLDAPGKLAEYLQIPFGAATYTNYGFFTNEPVGPVFTGGIAALGHADVALLLNVGLNMNAASTFEAVQGKRVIAVNREPSGIGDSIDVEVGIIGSPCAVAAQILEAVKRKTEKRTNSPYGEAIVAGLAQGAEQLMPMFEREDLLPSTLMYQVQKFLSSEEGAEYCYVYDGGDAQSWGGTAAAFFMNEPNKHIGRIFANSRFGCIGTGPGCAVGLWAATGRPIVLTTGDGSFGEEMSEVFTFAAKGMKVITLISNDGYWGMIRMFADKMVPGENNALGSTIKAADGRHFAYEKIAEAWGGIAVGATRSADILPAMIRAHESGLPAIIDCPVPYDIDIAAPSTWGCYSHMSTLLPWYHKKQK